jgi:23S rRNA pseudouridine2604 synthase
VRVNKCFKADYSRREADALVENGRVTINGRRASPGARVCPGDVVALNGEPVEWERLAAPDADAVDQFTYIKMHKPVDVVTTTAADVPNNIIACLNDAGYRGRDRVFPVGRLDEASSGLIILTTDGTLVNSALGAGSNSEKEYLVRTDVRVSEEHIQELRTGVVIKTVAQSSRGRIPLVAPTLPCICERVSDEQDDCRLRIVLREGRNRQIRKMVGNIGDYTVREIFRRSFMGITLRGIERPGSWALLDEDEMCLVRKTIATKESHTVEKAKAEVAAVVAAEEAQVAAIAAEAAAVAAAEAAAAALRVIPVAPWPDAASLAVEREGYTDIIV